MPGVDQGTRDAHVRFFSVRDTVYVTPSGQTVNGTRQGLGPAFLNDDYDASIGNSNYNSFQATLRHSTKRLTLLIGYTFSKSIDQASSLADPLNPFNLSATRAISAWDLKHNLVASYEYNLPVRTAVTPACEGLDGVDGASPELLASVPDFRSRCIVRATTP